MKKLLIVPIAVAVAGVAFATGLVLGPDSGSNGNGGPLADGEIEVRFDDGDTRVYTATEAAARIEQLEGMLRRRSERSQRRESMRESELELAGVLARLDDGDLALPARADGRPYTFAEIVQLALESEDPAIRKAAIRRLRRVNTPQAREVLKDILADEGTPAELRLEAAAALSRPPHRDTMTAELISMLAAEEDPTIRGVLADGVARLRERGAWMSEISAIFGEEQDPEVRAALLGAVARSSRDPAARQELLDLAMSPSASLEERQAALGALTRGRSDKELRETVAPLLADADPAIRRDALRILAGSRDLAPETLRDGLEDADPSVRRTALDAGLRHLKRMGKAKDADKALLGEVVVYAVRLAASDPDPLVRRSAVQQVWNLPKKRRNEVLKTGRADPDDRVRLMAYANSSRDVARSATPEFVRALSSEDASLRGFAYRQLQRLHGVKEPYNPGWNPEARARAEAQIQAELAGSQ